MTLETNTWILDATAFIRMDFSQLQATPNVLFFTTQSVGLELKDFRSRMNLDSLRYSGRLKFSNPQDKIIQELKKQIQKVDPQTTLSSTDIEVLALAIQLKGTLISNDLNLQNAAYHFKIPIKVLSGKKIVSPRKWQLKCQGCGKLSNDTFQICPNCGGSLKRVQIKPVNLDSELME